MINTIKYLLLDLDGTLIKFDLNTFIQNYLRLIQDNFAHLMYASSVPEWILAGTGIMLSSVKTINLVLSVFILSPSYLYGWFELIISFQQSWVN